MAIEKVEEGGVYEMHIRFFGNELFAVGFKTPDTSNRVVLLGTVSVFAFLSLLGAYGDKIVQLYKYLAS
jgi:hypothetical protein